MNVNLIALAVPFFLGLIALELLICQKKGKQYYRLNDSVSNLSNGIGSQALSLIFKLIAIGAYTLVYDSFAQFKFSMNNPWHWVLALTAQDFCYYWFHRASHRSNLLVAAHTVHHQSEEYNLTVALRQSWWTRAFVWFFYLPLAIIGIPPLMYVSITGILLIYQFWIHTRLIGTLGILEYILVTPSHHRVHHGRNGRYIDKNHGALLIWWDMLFGTFEKEIEPVEFGVANPVKSWNPAWNNVSYFVGLGKRNKLMSGAVEKTKLWWGKPEWHSPKEVTTAKAPYVQYDSKTPSNQTPWMLMQFLLCLALLGFLYSQEKALPLVPKILGAGLVCWGLANVGGLQDQKSWVKSSQLALAAAIITFSAGYFLT